MKNPELYNRTVDILVMAYFNDTLHHKSCTACAVGNIIAANNGYSIKNKGFTTVWVEGDTTVLHPSANGWATVFFTSSSVQHKIISNFKYEAKRQIESTGYSLKDVMKIEFAFESAPIGNSDEDWMFNGLMAVIDVLDIIHENTDEVLSKEIKSKFQKQTA